MAIYRDSTPCEMMPMPSTARISFPRLRFDCIDYLLRLARLFAS